MEITVIKGGSLMIIIFFVLVVGIFSAIFLATIMFANHLRNISRSINIFLDPKAYKPENEIAFISSLVDKYQKYENELLMNQGIDALVSDCFYKEKVGIFKLSTIETIASRGKRLLWPLMIMMLVFEGITNGLGQSMINSALIISSGVLGLLLIFFQLSKNLDWEKQRLLTEIKSYLYHTYPYLKSKKKKEKQVSSLMSKIDLLENQIEDLEQISQAYEATNIPEQDNNLELGEQDIIQLIEHFV